MKVWEVWNEPNIAPFWELPNPAEYAALLQATRARLRKVDRSCADPLRRSRLSVVAVFDTARAKRVLARRDRRRRLEELRCPAAPHVPSESRRSRGQPDRRAPCATLKTYGGVDATGRSSPPGLGERVRAPDGSVDDPATPDDEAAASELAAARLAGRRDGPLGGTTLELEPRPAHVVLACVTAMRPTATWHCARACAGRPLRTPTAGPKLVLGCVRSEKPPRAGCSISRSLARAALALSCLVCLAPGRRRPTPHSVDRRGRLVLVRGPAGGHVSTGVTYVGWVDHEGDIKVSSYDHASRRARDRRAGRPPQPRRPRQPLDPGAPGRPARRLLLAPRRARHALPRLERAGRRELVGGAADASGERAGDRSATPTRTRSASPPRGRPTCSGEAATTTRRSPRRPTAPARGRPRAT